MVQLDAALKALDGELANRRFLLGDALTEPDLLLFALLARFDVGYRGAFHCAPGRFICGDEPRGFPHLQHFAREVYQIAGVAPTCEFGVYLTFYAMLPMTLSKLGCVPGSLLTLLGVRRELSLPHER
ncbi:MAG: hypothetical protein HOI19_09410, partial [Rhodospirillaceae bacterium]|nr:hypothetical protein [Rhodospirillaceae bacterium]